MPNALLDEVFASIQGEGPHVGRRHIFVRFLGCDLGCRYCDTPAARITAGAAVSPCRVQVPSGTGHTGLEMVPNPVSASDLTRFCSRLMVKGISRPVISLTGGEPLLQADFLRSWIPEVHDGCSIYLETSGIHHEELLSLQGLVDVVSMDMKLPSATGQKPYWDEHRNFLSACRGREVFVKVVVTASTSMDDILMAASLIEEKDPAIPLVLQPASGNLAPDPLSLIRIQEAVLPILADVRVIPQMHKILNVP